VRARWGRKPVMGRAMPARLGIGPALETCSMQRCTSAPASASGQRAGGDFPQVRGQPLLRRQVADLDLVLLRPTIPEPGVPEHAHDDMHLVLLLAGGYVSSAQGMPEVCTEPALVFNPPGVEHRDRFRSRDGLFLTLSLPAHAFVALTGDAPAAPAQRLGPAAMNLAFRLLRESASADQAQALATESLLAEMLDLAAVPPVAADAPALRRALARLHDGSDWPSIADLAAAAGVHPVYLARLFRRSLGVSPGDYLRRLRCLRALELLGRGRSAESAALRSGHVDASHLGRALRREFGISPGSVRRAVSKVARVPAGPTARC
jgi:AraC family transcriptional regulator